MFTVKATYRNETRRFSFPDSVLFPTYDELLQQLHRIFPINNNNYYLSSLIFSPDASSPGRILVGREVHSADDYESRIAPLRRHWPNPLLRFSIFDETPHKAPSTVPERSPLYSTITVPPYELPPLVPRHNTTLLPCPPEFYPPPPPPRLPPVSCTIPPPFPPFNISAPPLPPLCPSASSKSSSSDECSKAKTQPCCSITQAKGDIQVLLSSFKVDLERILCRTLGTDYASNVKESAGSASNVNVPPRTPANPSADTSARWCFVCKTSFTGGWYGCLKCPWHAICPACFAKSYSAHTLSFGPSHVVQQRSADSAPPVSTQMVRDDSTGTQQSLAPASFGLADEPALAVHRGVVCDSCNKTIVGVRHKCLDCSNYDLCTTCVQSGATEKHNPFHEFLDIKTPGRVHIHTVLGDRGRSFANHQHRSRAQVTRQGPADIPTDPPARHFATCNLCDSAIVGERYKCVVCPDFDTCSSCFRITMEQHPSHGFVKVSRPEDLMIRDSPPLRQVAHLAICDSCEKTIRGPRYKCMHSNCPDFDLCGDCEALPIPVHPLNHPMLKMRTADTIIPTVYRAEQTQTMDEPATQKTTVVCGESRSPTSLLANPTKSPEPRPVIVELPPAEEFLSPLGSPASEVPGVAPASIPIAPPHLLVDVSDPPELPRPVLPDLDIFYELWPRVNQEMMHLNEVGAPKDEAIAPTVGGAILAPLGVELLVADKAQAGSPVGSSVHQAAESRGTDPVSPVPSIKSIVDGYCTPSSTPSTYQEPHDITHSPGEHEEIATMKASLQRLDSVFVGDTNVPDGQIFPPGAEFVKGWHLMNNGVLPWPPTTEVQFVAGEMFAPERSTALRARVGVAHPGQDLDIWTGDLKAPDTPGRYVGYWRLSDGQGNFFGNSMWIDLTVADHHSDQASEESLASSSMVMPSGHPTNSVNVSDEPQDAPQPSLPSTKTVTDEVEDHGSDISSVSLLSVPTSDDEDAEWQDTRTHSEPMEYMVLYGSDLEE